MTLLGLDFDNTLVRYDKLFHKIALEKSLIEDSLPANKTAIRDYLRSQGQDEQFTLLQGEVYGLRILEAEPAPGMLEALQALKRKNVSMVLISHKTRKPYKGVPYDLHKAGWNWLEENGFFADEGLNWSNDQIFFEESKQKKIERIKNLECDFYIDDLPEVLELLPQEIKAILYDPQRNHISTCLRRITHWKQATKIAIE